MDDKCPSKLLFKRQKLVMHEISSSLRRGESYLTIMELSFLGYGIENAWKISALTVMHNGIH